ncbi:MAG TPA: hypothetical protein VNW92_03400 [Polyangiaceae bacterium]|jgi:tetratricopeptide (TPR) repeat protein|nr:hypothetical protein [Polyangiaceae bacterium]
MDFESFLNDAWSDHAEQPEAVAERLGQGTALIQETAQITRFAQLAAHVFGEHLGHWRRGILFLETLRQLPSFAANAEAEATLVRLIAALGLAHGDVDIALPHLRRSDRVRVWSLAAAALTGQAQTERAAELFSRALEQASALGHDDPAQRALAVTSNNLAADLEQKAERTASQTALMVLCARTARTRWALAGTWLNVERAEYRLARSYLAAGELTEALEHAQSCLAISRANRAEPRELFWGFECLARVAHARQDGAAFDAALLEARAALSALSASAGDCERALEQLARLD